MSARVEKSAEEVAAQREVKKSEDAIRKLESALKKQAEGSEERATTQSEIDRLNARVAELCEHFGLTSKAGKKAAGANAGKPKASQVPPADNTTTAAPSPAASSQSVVASPTEEKAPGPLHPNGVNNTQSTSIPSLEIGVTMRVTSGPRPDPARLKEELEQCKAKLLQQDNTTPEQIEELRARMATLVDLCITLASDQALLATARASPAVAPRQSMTPALQASTTGTGSGAQVPPMELPTSASVSAVLPPTPSSATVPTGGAQHPPSSNLPTSRSTFDTNNTAGDFSSDVIPEGVHPRFQDLAIRMGMLQIVGGNARALALVDALLAFVRSTRTLSEDTKMLGPREKNAFLRQFTLNIDALRKARPLCQSMQYVVDAFTARINFGEFVLQEKWFIRDQVAVAVADVGDSLILSIKKLSERTQEISDDDTILVFGRSSSIENLLLNAAASIKSRFVEPVALPSSTDPKRFTSVAPNRLRVIVLDSAPLFEGRGLARRLQAKGVAVRYSLASAASQVMPLCTKVFLGVSAVMQSGDVVSRCGTAMVAACAKASQKPVFFFAEDHKLTREVWIGSLTRNELVHSGFHPLAGQTAYQQQLFAQDGAPTNSGSRTGAPLPPNGYLYDVTPSSLIDVIVTRMGRIHPTAVCSLILPDTDEEAAKLDRYGEGRAEGDLCEDEYREDDDEGMGAEEGLGDHSGMNYFASPEFMK